MVKLIAIDLDDTLLNKNKEISYDNCLSIRYALEKGIKIIIATGRPYFRVESILKKLNIFRDDSYVITFNGGIISNAINSEIIYEKLIDNNDIREIVNIINEFSLCYNIYKNNDIYTTKVVEDLIKLPVFNGIKFCYTTDKEIEKLDYAHKIIISDKKEKIDKYHSDIVKKLNDKWEVFRTTPNFLEILPKGVNKGNSLKILIKRLKIKETEVMAIGDAENDVPMFDVAMIKVAMGNSAKSLKDKATFITKTCEESGVSFAIRTIIGKEEEKNE